MQGCVYFSLQEHFRQSKPAKTAEQLQRQRQQLLANVPEEQRAQINEQMLGVATGVRKTSWQHLFCLGQQACCRHLKDRCSTEAYTPRRRKAYTRMAASALVPSQVLRTRSHATQAETCMTRLLLGSASQSDLSCIPQGRMI